MHEFPAKYLSNFISPITVIRRQIWDSSSACGQSDTILNLLLILMVNYGVRVVSGLFKRVGGAAIIPSDRQMLSVAALSFSAAMKLLVIVLF